MDVLTFSHVSKAFGSHQVLKDLTFQVPEHTIYGFVGPNGAGKTTSMRMALGLCAPDSGEITLCQRTVRPGNPPKGSAVGYLPDVPEFYGYMTPSEYLDLAGSIAGIPKREKREQIRRLLDLVGLEDSKRIRGFSRGMKQRLGIAQALLGNPRLLICDEPTSALDPLGRKEILEILLKVRRTTTVIFSTHILSDVERICDSVGVLFDGRLVFSGTLEEVHRIPRNPGFLIEFSTREEAGRFLSLMPGGRIPRITGGIEIPDNDIRSRISRNSYGKTGTLPGEPGSPASSAPDLAGFRPGGPGTLLYEHAGSQAFRRAMETALASGLTPIRLEQQEATLENLFLQATGGDGLRETDSPTGGDHQ